MQDKVTKAVTDQIIKKLEEGVVPWQKSWFSRASLGEHRNGRSKKPYRGINAVITAMSGYTSPNWYTFKDICESGFQLKEGQKHTKVMLWKFKKEEEEDEGEETNRGRRRPLKRYFRIFNEAQLEGYENPEEVEALVKGQDNGPIESAERIINAWDGRPKIDHSDVRLQAFYSPSCDLVSMPELRFFNCSEEYYSTLFHELTHSTGHKSRLNRKTLEKINNFGDHSYSKEELVAELGSAFLCAQVGISQSVINNQASYIDNWLKAIKGDRGLVIEAAQKAQKARDLILGVNYKGEKCS